MIGRDKEKALQEKMAQLGVRQEDIEEKFIRSQGPGGQNVNKVASCVYLKHIPTGIEVKCQQERSQAQNRLFARQVLLMKIESAVKQRLSEEKKAFEKSRRQKRKRPHGLKVRILEWKRRHSVKKSFRVKVQNEEP